MRDTKVLELSVLEICLLKVRYKGFRVVSVLEMSIQYESRHVMEWVSIQKICLLKRSCTSVYRHDFCYIPLVVSLLTFGHPFLTLPWTKLSASHPHSTLMADVFYKITFVLETSSPVNNMLQKYHPQLS